MDISPSVPATTAGKLRADPRPVEGAKAGEAAEVELAETYVDMPASPQIFRAEASLCEAKILNVALIYYNGRSGEKALTYGIPP